MDLSPFPFYTPVNQKKIFTISILEKKNSIRKPINKAEQEKQYSIFIYFIISFIL